MKATCNKAVQHSEAESQRVWLTCPGMHSWEYQDSSPSLSLHTASSGGWRLGKTVGDLVLP